MTSGTWRATEGYVGCLSKATKDAARVIRDITNTPIFVPEGKGKINVCKAVQDMIYEHEELAEIRTLVKQIQNGRLTIEQAAEDSNRTVEQFKDAMSKLPLEAVCIA